MSSLQSVRRENKRLRSKLKESYAAIVDRDQAIEKLANDLNELKTYVNRVLARRGGKSSRDHEDQGQLLSSDWTAPASPGAPNSYNPTAAFSSTASIASNGVGSIEFPLPLADDPGLEGVDTYYQFICVLANKEIIVSDVFGTVIGSPSGNPATTTLSNLQFRELATSRRLAGARLPNKPSKSQMGALQHWMKDIKKVARVTMCKDIISPALSCDYEAEVCPAPRT